MSPNEGWEPVLPVESSRSRLSHTMLALILITCIALLGAGLLGGEWTAAAQDQPTQLHGTVPTRTPKPTLDKKLYLPIIARAS